MCVKLRVCFRTVLKKLTKDDSQEPSFIFLLSSGAGRNLKLTAKRWKL